MKMSATSTHPISVLFILCSVTGSLEPISGDSRQKVGDNPTQGTNPPLGITSQIHSHTTDNIEVPNQPTTYVFGLGKETDVPR